ncbi:hypothetical protein D3C71_1154630 [compost metagenome]
MQVAGGVFGAVGQVVVALRDFARRGGDAVGGGAHVGDQLAQRSDHVGEPVKHRAWVGRGDVCIEIAFGHLRHDRDGVSGLSPDLAQHGARYEQADGPHHKNHHHHHGQARQQGLAQQHVHVIGIQPRAHHPVPAVYTDDVLELGHRGGLVGAGKHGGDKRLAILAAAHAVHQQGDDVYPRAVLDLAQHVLPIPLGFEGVHHPHALGGPDVEILGLALGAAIARNAQGVLGGLLGLLLGHGAAGGLGLVGGHNAVGGLDGGGQQLFSGLGDESSLLQEGGDGHDQQRNKRSADHEHDFHFEAELAHGSLLGGICGVFMLYLFKALWPQIVRRTRGPAQ